MGVLVWLLVVVVTDSKAEHQKNDGANQRQREEGKQRVLDVVVIHNVDNIVASSLPLQAQPIDQAKLVAQLLTVLPCLHAPPPFAIFPPA